jgi:hypothetical protein
VLALWDVKSLSMLLHHVLPNIPTHISFVDNDRIIIGANDLILFSVIETRDLWSISCQVKNIHVNGYRSGEFLVQLQGNYRFICF